MSDTIPPSNPADDVDLAALERITPDEILRRIHASGFTEDSIVLLHLVPLVQVAWADGEVTQRERDCVMNVARGRGIEEAGPVHATLVDWLTREPSEEFFLGALDAIRTVLQRLNPGQRTEAQRDLLSYCKAIASASGGIFGFGKISDEEHEALELIAAELQRDNEAAVQAVLDKWRRIQDAPGLTAFP